MLGVWVWGVLGVFLRFGGWLGCVVSLVFELTWVCLGLQVSLVTLVLVELGGMIAMGVALTTLGLGFYRGVTSLFAGWVR